MSFKEEGQDEKKQRGPHPDWRRNYHVAKEYMNQFPKKDLYDNGTEENISYRFHIERNNLDGEIYPWIFWGSCKRKEPYFHACFPVFFHQEHSEFCSEMKRGFPLKMLIEKIISG